MSSLDNKTDFTAVGEYKNNRLKFLDQEQIANYVILKKDIIEYYKKGSVTMKFIFDKNKDTTGIYQIMGNELRFKIRTKELIINKEDLLVEYDLYQDNDLVNTNKLLITFRNLEEGN